jgi:hypothetical protein
MQSLDPRMGKPDARPDHQLVVGACGYRVAEERG